jgi:cytochrome c
MNVFSRILLAGVVTMLAGAAQAAEHATPEQAQALLDKAVAEIQMSGQDKAIQEFNDPKGGFTIGELYVFIFDVQGNYVASGANPKLVGTNAYDLKDAEGKPLVREMIAKGKSAGKGEVDYVWLNRADNHVEKKRSLIRKVGDYIVGVGYYMN